MKKRAKGEVTVFLSLLIIMLIAFVGGILESASIQVSKNYRRTDLGRAMESVFAEYQKDLLEQYDIFALDGAYGTGDFQWEKLVDRMETYGAEMELNVEKLQLLTDQSGQPFYEQVVSYMENRYGLNELTDLTGDIDIWNSQDGSVETYQSMDEEKNEEIKSALEESETSLPSEENPLENVTNLKASPLLEMIMPKDKVVSGQAIKLSEMPSRRKLQTGTGSFAANKFASGDLSPLFFNEYLLSRFRNATDSVGEEKGIAYELEYILAGGRSDRENLETVVKRLLLIRFAANMLYIETDEEKRAEAAALALSLTAAAGLPILEEPVKQAILLGWSYGESIMDLRALMKGNKVALLKTAETWQLSLSGLMTLGTGEGEEEGMDAQNGLDYRGYLRMLLYLGKKEQKTMRALDVLETHMKLGQGLESFQVDHCVSKLQMHGTCHLRRGITYDFLSEYGYQ